MPPTKPDSSHAIVVIGMGLDTTWPYPAFELTFPEYSAAKQSITGNCFHYNRIEATRPPTPAKVTYLAFEVPANTYVYMNTLNLVDSSQAAPLPENAFKAPAGGTVYVGDFVFVGHETVEFKRDIDAAQAAAKALLPRGAVLKLADLTRAPGARMFICTP
jgi:hypothetical protein